MFKWLFEKFVGVELNRENFKQCRIGYAIIVVIVTFIIFVPLNLFSIIENLFNLSKQPWYSEIMADFSFLMISIRIFFLSLFTDLGNPLGRLSVAFRFQFIGLIGSVVMSFLLNNFILSSQNIPSETKFIYMIFPYLLNLVMFVQMRRIYTDRNFDERDYFPPNSEKNRF